MERSLRWRVPFFGQRAVSRAALWGGLPSLARVSREVNGRGARVATARRSRPLPGDVRSQPRWKRNGGLTHIGVVERVSADGLVTFVHKAGGGVKRPRLHLSQRDVRRDGKGWVLNGWLRRADRKHPGQLA